MANQVQVPEDLTDQLKLLEKQLASHLEKPKCKWPLDVMAEIHATTGQITEIVAKELREAVQWPTAAHCHPEGFYAGNKNINPTFTRSKTDWLEKQGYSLHKTTYTYGNRWDRVPMTAAFYIPNNLQIGDEVPFMWYFHGGGYCTGANDFIPWFSKASLSHARAKKAIIIAPDYPLGPEGNYQDIIEALRDFLLFYKNDTCFEKDHETWTDWLRTTIGIPRINLTLDRVLVEGESAGGLAAATALFLNADKVSGSKIHISVALLRFPMIEHYVRSVDTYEYMTEKFERADIEARAYKIQTAISALEKSGFLPTRIRSAPPQHMCAAFILSVLGRWKGSFKRQHEGQKLSDEFDIMDGLERARHSVDKVDHAYLPPLLMYHGDADANCKVEKTLEFERILRDKYGTRYHDGTIKTRVVPGKGHGFDYELGMEDNDFLRETYADVDRHW